MLGCAIKMVIQRSYELILTYRMFNALINYPCFNCAGDYLGKDKLHVFSLTLPTFICCALLKSESSPCRN